MIKLQPQHLRQHDWDNVRDQLEVFFHEEIIAPLVKLIRADTAQKVVIANAIGDAALKRALDSGRIQYTRGIFSGDFSSTTSSALRALGATFDRRSGTFRLDQARAPQWIKAAASDYFARAHLAHEAIRRELDLALERVSRGRYDVDSDKTIKSIDEGWRKSAAKLAVKPPLTAEGKQALADDYSNNLDLSIKKWFKKDILRLRQDVQKNAEAGYRFDRLIETVQRRGASGKYKAKFLARQETGLFMSSYRAQRFVAAGVFKYQWSNSHDARVRPEANLTPQEKLHAGNHRVLDKNVFDYRTKAPAKFMSSGKPCNPGEDYNCRCSDIPLA